VKLCIGTIKHGGNIDHDYAGNGLARLYETARRKFTSRQTSATILQFPNGEKQPKLLSSGSDEQMFGAKQQVPHWDRSDQEAERRSSAGKGNSARCIVWFSIKSGKPIVEAITNGELKCISGISFLH
jgi:hypothetical protein